MSRKYADVTVSFLVSFEDDGKYDLHDQAKTAALDMVGIPEWEVDVQVLGEVRGEE